MPQQPQQSKIAQPSEPSSEEEHGSEAYTHDEEMSQTGSDMTGSQDEDEVSSESSQGVSWVEWFCSLPGHDWLCEVDEEFIDDDFNLTGLNQLVPNYYDALDMIQDIEPEADYDETDVSQNAATLYMLIHQRFLLSKLGQALLRERYNSAFYGHCPRVLCADQFLLPVGLSDYPKRSTVKLFCPRCVDLYDPPSSKHRALDGCAFGTTAPHLLVMNNKDLFDPIRLIWATNAFNLSVSGRGAVPQSMRTNNGDLTTDQQQQQNSQDSSTVAPYTDPSGIYVSRLYGFKIHPTSKSGPKMHWLRRTNVVGVVQQSENALESINGGGSADTSRRGSTNLVGSSNLDMSVVTMQQDGQSGD